MWAVEPPPQGRVIDCVSHIEKLMMHRTDVVQIRGRTYGGFLHNKVEKIMNRGERDREGCSEFIGRGVAPSRGKKCKQFSKSQNYHHLNVSYPFSHTTATLFFFIQYPTNAQNSENKQCQNLQITYYPT